MPIAGLQVYPRILNAYMVRKDFSITLNNYNMFYYTMCYVFES
jgi:hypothetical protein